MVELERKPPGPFAGPVPKKVRDVRWKLDTFLLSEGVRRKMTPGTIVLLGIVLVPVAIAKAGSMAGRRSLEGSGAWFVRLLAAADRDCCGCAIIFHMTVLAIPDRDLMVPASVRKVARKLRRECFVVLGKRVQVAGRQAGA